jgi:ABC-type Mn2+/Zn2+ transport system permease subunit
MIDEHSPGRFFSSFKHLSKQKDIIENASNFFLNIFLAIWSYFCINKTTKNRKDTTINTLFALFFGLKGIILMVLYDLLRESRLEKQLE